MPSESGGVQNQGVGETAPAVQYSVRYQRFAIALLAVVYVFNYVDRQVMNILAQSVKTDLGLSDTELGLVTGLAFAIFYSLLGLPIARYAERGDRPRLIAFAISLWSAFTIACGFVTSFPQLALCRLGVGVGEAGSVPPSHSLITEFTPRSKRARSLALFSVGLSFGSLVGLGFGGVLGDAFGWRMAFVIAGIPGLLIGAAVWLFIREPRRVLALSADRKPAENLWSTLASFVRIPTFRWVAAGGALQAVATYGSSAFMAPFFLRAHPEVADLAASFGLKPTGFLGLSFGLAIGLGGALGAFLGGYLSDRFSKNSIKSYATVPAIGTALSAFAFLFVFQTSSAVRGIAALAACYILSNSILGPMHAACQGSVSPQQRATMSAFMLVILNLVGFCVGPPLVGIISDYGRVSLGLADAEALRTALTINICAALLAGASFWRARRTIDADNIS